MSTDHRDDRVALADIEMTPSACDTEPVHTPGAVLPHGALLVLCPQSLVIRQVSANSAAWLDFAPDELIGQRIHNLIGATKAEALQQLAVSGQLDKRPRQPFSFVPGGFDAPLDVIAHTIDGQLILELEHSSQPDSTSYQDYFGCIKALLVSVQQAMRLRDYFDILAEDMRLLTGLDRVMIYRFAEDGSGWVYAESKVAELPPYRDLHYPAVDIPQSTRDLYSKIWLRNLPDAQAQPVPLVPELNPDTGAPLDMTYCCLRGVSEVHAQYLQNMGVRMSYTMPLRRDEQLWGMIACHHREPKLLGYGLRAASEFLAQVVSMQIPLIEEREQRARQTQIRRHCDALLSHGLAEIGLDLGQLFSERAEILALVDAQGAALRLGTQSATTGAPHGVWSRLGQLPDNSALEALVAWLRRQPVVADGGQGVLYTERLADLYPPAQSFTQIASGILAIPLSRSGEDWLLWVRPEMIHTLAWGGNPRDKQVVPGPRGARLMPRTSFAIWKETVRGRSPTWEPTAIEAARQLRLVLLEILAAKARRGDWLPTAADPALTQLYASELRAQIEDTRAHGEALERYCQPYADPAIQGHLKSIGRMCRQMTTALESLLLHTRDGASPPSE